MVHDRKSKLYPDLLQQSIEGSGHWIWTCVAHSRSFSPGCSLEGLMLKLKLQYFGHLMQGVDSLEKTLMLGGIWGQEKGMTEDEMAGRHHQLNGNEFEQAPGDGKGQGNLVFCSPWGHRVGHN